MISKIDAAKIMLSMGSDMVISKGDSINPLIRLKKLSTSTSTWFVK
jgi:glutamate 5-kinase